MSRHLASADKKNLGEDVDWTKHLNKKEDGRERCVTKIQVEKMQRKVGRKTSRERTRKRDREKEREAKRDTKRE